MKKNISKFGIYVIFLLAFVLRLININQSFWLDEAISAVAAKNYSFYDIVFVFLKGDNHPPLFYLLLRLWGLIFGFSDIALRMLPIICGTLTVVASYFFFKKISQNNYWITMVGTFLLAISPLHIYYSQEVRMYPVITLLAVLLMYFFSFLISGKTKSWQWIVFSLLLIWFVGTDYVSLFMLPVLGLLGILERLGKKWWLKFGLSFLPLAILGLLWLPVLSAQMETAKQQLVNLPGWRALAGGATFKEAVVLWMKFILGRITIDPHIFYYALVGMFSLPILAVLFFAGKKYKQNIFLWSYLLVPLIVSYLVSFFIPAFNYFRMIYVLPAFYILIAIGVYQVKNKPLQKIVLSLLILGCIIGNGFYFFNQRNQREQWKQAVSYIETNGSNDSLAIFEFPEPFAPFQWYSTGKIPGYGALDGLTSHQELTNQKINTQLSNFNGTIFYFSYLRDLTDGGHNIEQELTKLGYSEKSAKSFAGVGEVVTYEK